MKSLPLVGSVFVRVQKYGVYVQPEFWMYPVANGD